MDPTADSPVASSSSGASVVTSTPTPSAAAEEPAKAAAAAAEAAAPPQEPPYPLDDLEVKLRAHLATTDVTSTTLKEIRKQMEDALGVNLKVMKDDIKKIVTAYLQEIENARAAKEAEEAEAEDDDDDEGMSDVEEPVAKKRKSKLSGGKKSGGGSGGKLAYYWVISAALMEFLGAASERMEFKEAQTRVQDYIKAHLKKNQNDKSKYVCDAKLEALFGVKNIKLFGVGKQLKKHCKQWVDAPPPAADDSDDDDAPAPARKKAKGGSSSKGKKASGGEIGKGRGKTAIEDLKKPQSAYFLFMNAERDAIKAANPGASFGEMGKIAGELWRGMSDKAKAPWEKQAAKAKRKYEDDVKALGGKGKMKKAKAAKAAKEAKEAKEGGGKAAGGFAAVPYSLSTCMRAVCAGEKALPRPQVVKKIWEYIKANGLQNPEKKSEILCDARLKAIFDGNATVTSFSLNKYISAHLTKIES